MAEITLSRAQMALGNKEMPPTTAVQGQYTGRMIEPKDWFSVDYLKNFVPRGKCQGTQPSCNTYATGKAYQTKYAFLVGRAGFVKEVSYSALHQEITGGNMNDGSMPIDAIKLVQQKGFYPVTKNLPEWYESGRYPTQEEEEARKLLQADEWEPVRTGAEVVSAVLNGDPCDIGFWWCEGDVNVGATGHLRMNPGQRLGGHALTACGVVMSYKYSPSGVGVLFNNHHGDSKTPATHDERGNVLRFPVWGDDGFGIVPIERLDADLPVFGGWALRTVKVQNEDIPG